jgi:uroporphyrinogen decarboxylase
VNGPAHPEPWTSSARLAAALVHREPDRIPFDLGGFAVTGINVRALRRLRAYLGLSGEPELWDPITQLARTGRDVGDLLGVDVTCAVPRPPSRPGLDRDEGRVGDYYRITDELGIGWRMPVAGGHYYDLYHHPLANAETARDVERYPWPDPTDPARFAGMREKARTIVEQEQRGLVVERMFAGMWETAMWMTGYEKFFCDMLENEALVHALMEKMLEITCAYWERALAAVGNQPCVVSTADDLGTQTGLLVSLEMYRKLILPYHRRLFAFIKKASGGNASIFFHNDGAIMPTIPLLIEAGVDILNPFQVNCTDMDPARFKKQFGNDITIWGGSCSPVTLQLGTAAEVREETARRIDALAPGGGFVFAPIHIIQGDVPAENIMAWRDALWRQGAY